MVTEQDILDAGFVPYQYVWVSNIINRETGKYDRKKVVRDDVFVLPTTPLDSPKTLPSNPYIIRDVKRQLEPKNGKMVEVEQTIRFEGRHGALGFPLNENEQLIKFKSYVNENSR